MSKKYASACLPGVRDWMESTGLVFENPAWQDVPYAQLQPGDVVYGCMGLRAAAEICAKGARAITVEYTIPPGRPSASAIDWETEIYNFNPRFVEYVVEIK